ncbi:lamin tail domain-containing protein [Streptomyces sp. NPDC005863]|uniref:lamin tail domain-containing protein n=1 Tax=unclassified Streptomyces TaxID=2593676 RepID=UPI0033CEF5DC
MSASSTARRLAATAVTVGAVISTVALPAAAADHGHHRQPQVAISAVQADSPGRDDNSNRSRNAEWVKITNTTRHSVNLKGWTLRNRDGQTYRFRNVWLAGRSSVKVHTGVGHDTRADLYQDRRHYVWDNHADKALLRNDHNRTVDAKSWGRGGHHHNHH